MNRQSPILVAALLCMLPILSVAQVKRANLTIDQAFGHQTPPPSSVCDDRDIVGGYRTKLQFKGVLPRNAPVEFEVLFSPQTSDSSLRVRLQADSRLRLKSGAVVSDLGVVSGNVYRAKWSVDASALGRHPVTVYLEGSELPPASVNLFIDVHREGITLTQGAPFLTYKEVTTPRKQGPRFSLAEAERLAKQANAGQRSEGTKRLLATAYISGYVYTWNGVGGWQTVGGTLVNVGQWSGSTWRPLWSGYTDGNGYYAASYEWNNALGAGPTKTIVVSCLSYGASGQVLSPALGLYQYDQANNVGMSATAHVYMNDGVNNERPEGAFKILDTMNKARNYSALFGDSVAPTRFIWPSNGSYFIPNITTPDIHIGSSWDEWSKVDVAGHEFGHFHHFRICGNWLPPSPGGAHSFNQLQDPILAFVEGYATFFMNMAFNKTDYLGWINLEDNLQTVLYGQRNEAAVAGTMLDIADNTPSEVGDFLNNLHFAWVKDVVKNRPNTMKDFHDRWVAWGWPYLNELRLTMVTHGMVPPLFVPY